MMDYYSSTVTANSTTDRSDDVLFLFEDYNQRIVIAFVLCIVLVLGTVGNSLVILAVVLSRKLRSPTNWFIVNLAVADLLTCLTLPINIVAMLSKDGWPLPSAICAVNAAITFICANTSVMTLALIAYNRWFLLTQPKIKFQRLYTWRFICLMVGVAWLFPFLLVMIPATAGLGKLGYSKEYKTCTQDTSTASSEYYSLIVGAGAVIPVFIAIALIYFRIYRFVSRQNKKMTYVLRSTGTSFVPKGPEDPGLGNTGSNQKKGRIFLKMNPPQDISSTESTENCTSTTGSSTYLNAPVSNSLDKSKENGKVDIRTLHPDANAVNQPPLDDGFKLDGADRIRPQRVQTNERSAVARTNGSSQKRATQLNHHQVTVTKKLCIVVLAFLICLLPFGVSVAVPQSDPGIPWTGLLVTFNSCINPIIYAWTMPVFRRVMHGMPSPMPL